MSIPRLPAVLAAAVALAIAVFTEQDWPLHVFGSPSLIITRAGLLVEGFAQVPFGQICWTEVFIPEAISVPPLHPCMLPLPQLLMFEILVVKVAWLLVALVVTGA